MVVLDAPLDPVTVASLKGTLDYYLWRGIPVVRSWPRSPQMPRTAAVTEAYTDFGLTAQLISGIPLPLQEAAREWTKGTTWTWRDIWTAALYGNLYADDPEPLPEPDMTAAQLIAGQYYNGPTSTGALTTQSTATGTIWACPFYNPAYNDFDRIGIEITATTTGTIRLGIYGPFTDAPGTAPLVHDSGLLTPAGTGLLQQTIGLGLNPGWYLLCYQTSLTRTIRSVGAAEQPNVWGNPTGAAQRQTALITSARAYGAFPATLGAGIAYAGADRPYVLLRAM